MKASWITCVDPKPMMSALIKDGEGNLRVMWSQAKEDKEC